MNLPFEHLTAVEKLNRVGSEKWQNNSTFSFVRNPFDKVCSHHRDRVQTNQTNLKLNAITFSNWIKKTCGEKDPFYFDKPKMFMPHVNWLSDEKGELIIYNVYRFETLHEDFDSLCKKLSLVAKLAHLKATQSVDYQSYYATETKNIIERYFAQALKQFNYHF